MLLRLQKHDFELHTQVVIADTLNRTYFELTDLVKSFDEDIALLDEDIAHLDEAATDTEQEQRMVDSERTINRIKTATHENPCISTNTSANHNKVARPR